MDLNRYIGLRRYIHQHPELSGDECHTHQQIRSVVEANKPSAIISLGKTGLAAVYEGTQKGKTTMIRAELDALPIQEESDLTYRSIKKGVAHLCGHDGHMSILAGLSEVLSKNPPAHGRVVLLFQPSEETGEGAKEVMHDNDFQNIEPDYIFALHNIPGFDRHKILCKANTFALASKGLTLKLLGKTAHAAEPEKGISPGPAVAEILNSVQDIVATKKYSFTSKVMLTIVHISLGEIAFGTSPGYAEVRITLRAQNDEDMILLSQKTESVLGNIAKKHGLGHEIQYQEIFPATVNDADCVDAIKNAADDNTLAWEQLCKPFSWSEDFGYYTQKYKGGFFGLGSGIDQPALHNPGFDFPDELIETGIKMFQNIIYQIHH